MSTSHGTQCATLCVWNHLDYLTQVEADQIREQFHRSIVNLECQVMWTGVPREWVQQWAEQKKMQTLTSVMGPLMLKQHSTCLKMSKTPSEWSKYVRGASGLFAQYISRATCVTVLTRPPPHTLNPLGASTYQQIEEPLLKGSYGGFHVLRIDMVHPTVIGAENFRYQVWPVDETEKWIAVFGDNPPLKRRLNDTKVLYLTPSLTQFSASITEPRQPSCVNGEKMKPASNHPQQEVEKQGQKQTEHKHGKKKIKQEKIKQEKIKQEKIKQEKIKQEKIKQEKIKQEKIKQEKIKQEKIKQEKIKQEKIKQEKVKQEKIKKDKAKQSKPKKQKSMAKKAKATGSQSRIHLEFPI